MQGKSIIGDNIVTSDDETETTDKKQIAKSETTPAKAAVVTNAPSTKIDETQIQNLILTSLKKIVANETPSPPKKAAVAAAAANTGTANKTIARRTIPARTQVRNTGNNSNRQQPIGNRNDGGNARANIASMNRNFSGGNGNSMLSDFGLNRNLNFGNDIGNNMANSMGNSNNNMRNSMGDSPGGGSLSFGLDLRGNSSYDSNMMRGGLSNPSDFSSDFSSIGMRRSTMMGLGSNSNSMMGSSGGGRGFNNNNGGGMGMSGSNFNNSRNLWGGNSNNSNGGNGGGGGYNNSWNGNSNRY